MRAKKPRPRSSRIQKPALTQARLRELLDYNAATGEFTWRVKTSSRAHVGGVAGGPDNLGYVKIGIDGRDYRAQRLVWLYVYGEWPKYMVDHIDGNPANNAFRNLRDVVNAINQQNRKRARACSSHGFMGTTKTRYGWAAKIWSSGKRLCLGIFKTPEEAHAAYLDAKRRLHPGCTI